LNIDLTAKPFYLNQDQIKWVNETLANLTTEEKIGQLFALDTNTSTKKDLQDILSYQPGGVFIGMHLKEHNWQAAKFLQENSRIPLLIAGDLENGGLGGAINGTWFSTQMGIAATDLEDMAYKFGLVIGREGRAVGYNWAYSPMLDINFNFRSPIVSVRSFGDQPDKVLRMALAQIKGIQECGLAATGKHWPGDGMDDRNQHYVTSVNTLSYEEWQKSYGMVYKGVIDAGVKTLMSAHIYFPAYYKKMNPNTNPKDWLPGSLSYELNTKLLREELGFNGLIVNDASGMIGIKALGNRDFIVPQVINSGVDMFLFARGRKEDYARMKQAIETGVISEQRLNECLTRILGLKASLNLHEKKINGTLIPPKSDLKIVGGKEHNQWARDCAQHSITLVKDTQKIIQTDSPYSEWRILVCNLEIQETLEEKRI
jgi:beta-N-acetylhexosaminidase